MMLDVGDLGGHLHVTYRSWAATLAARVWPVIRGLMLVAALPLDFRGRCRVVRATFNAGALHGVEASAFSEDSLRQLLSAIVSAVWSHRQPLAHGSIVLSLLDGIDGFDPGFCICPVWVPPYEAVFVFF